MVVLTIPFAYAWNHEDHVCFCFNDLFEIDKHVQTYHSSNSTQPWAINRDLLSLDRQSLFEGVVGTVIFKRCEKYSNDKLLKLKIISCFELFIIWNE